MKLVSVPHTGTVFTRYVLGQLGMRDRRETKAEGEYMSYHSYDEFGVGPYVVPLRDPMRAEMSRINRGWGSPVEDWDRINALDAHYFRVQEPEPGRSRFLEVKKLANFVGKDMPAASIDWTPRNTWSDIYDFRARYERGDVAPELRRAWDWLKQSDATKALFEAEGYALPWM